MMHSSVASLNVLFNSKLRPGNLNCRVSIGQTTACKYICTYVAHIITFVVEGNKDNNKNNDNENTDDDDVDDDNDDYDNDDGDDDVMIIIVIITISILILSLRGECISGLTVMQRTSASIVFGETRCDVINEYEKFVYLRKFDSVDGELQLNYSCKSSNTIYSMQCLWVYLRP